ncbi:hypothetical protein P3S68_022941 [Capsicum galapagoense]
MYDTAVNIIVGSHVWVEDPDVAWIDGEVKKITNRVADIERTDGKKASGSSQGPLDKSVAQPMVEATTENNACSNHSSDYKACVQRNQECIEKRSDAQLMHKARVGE